MNFELAEVSNQNSHFSTMVRLLPRSRITKLIIVALLIHTLVLKAAFDIYFSSPVDHGMTPIRSTNKPPAKRLVLIIADGLRAEAIYGKGQYYKAPNLMNIRLSRGASGTAYTRVPTESRPGHVALLGGIFEDPSAILSGWKKNPVEFDSVINQSTQAWCWGSPDIVKMFNIDNSPHIHVDTYDEHDEDFGKRNTSDLDLWVFDKVEEFVKKQMQCETCYDFHKEGNLFFLHLLGIDTAGHGYKPNSPEYTENIRIVDENILKVEELFERAFPDGSTAYIFTADHGMTDWGSHGAGSAHETDTPIIAWGAGIKHDVVAKDINQVDIAPLISSLIGINFPTNSLGKLPYKYINASAEVVSNMLIANVKQLYEIFSVKRHRRKVNAIRFVPYLKVADNEIEERVSRLTGYIELRRFDELRVECDDLINILKAASNYYHNYYQLPILMAITVGLVAWIIYLATWNINLIRTRRNEKFLYNIQLFGFLPAYFFIYVALYVQQLPLMYHAYFYFPLFIAQALTRKYLYLLEGFRAIKNIGFGNSVLYCATLLMGIRLLVLGFTYRRTYTVLLNFMALSVFASRQMRQTTTIERLGWMLSCCAVAVFPFFPVMQTQFNPICYLISYLLWWGVIGKFINLQLEHPQFLCNRTLILSIQREVIKFTPIFMFLVENELIAVDSNIKLLAFAWTIYPILCIPNSCDNVFVRLTSVFAGFTPFYLLVSTNYEGIFLMAYSSLLFMWIIIECRSVSSDNLFRKRYTDQYHVNRNICPDDYRRAFFFVAFIFVGFFGTGNIASLNSFDPMWVRCFLTVFSPFKMAGLILLKIMVPFIFASCAFQAIDTCRRNDLHKMFCLVLMISDVMVLELLFHITNVGSWLEIGMSLSHFILMEVFVVIILILYGIANFFTTTNYMIGLNNYFMRFYDPQWMLLPFGHNDR